MKLLSDTITLEHFAEAVTNYGLRRGYEVLAEAGTTSDFPILLSNEMNKVLQGAYKSVPDEWQRFTRQVDVADFKEQKVIKLTEADDLLPLAEMEEYQDSTLAESQEGYKVAKYGREFSVSWETIVNDDLNGITRQPERFGRAAGRLVNKLIYNLLETNPTMSDSKALFHVDHGNLITDALSETGLQNALIKLRTQKDDRNNPISLRPRYILVPPHQEVIAKKLVQSTTALSATAQGVVNPFQGIAEVIVCDWLTDTNDWYLLADPADVDGIYVAFLRMIGRTPQLFVQESGWRFVGGGVPDITQGVGQTADAIKYRVRHVVGVKAIDWRFAVKAQVS